ncbi:Uncharacterised protein [uncultured archaeon]|nr:Uncharacterised protein [uncultured archaeon]
MVEVATYIKEFEDYSDGYDDSPSEISVKEEKRKIGKSTSGLERTIKVSITQRRTNKEACAVEGIVYRRWAILSQKMEGALDLKELSQIGDTLIELGYQRVGL